MTNNFDRILFCTDFSDEADNALLTAINMAERYQARLFVLHVLHSVYQSMPDNCENPEAGGGKSIFSPELLEKGTLKLKERYEKKMGALKSHYEFHVVYGIPFMEIIRFARAQKINCIVLGAAGTSNIRRIAFGSTAENVARRAHCSVMVIRDPDKDF